MGVSGGLRRVALGIVSANELAVQRRSGENLQ